MNLIADATFNALLVEPGRPPREVWVENSQAGILAHIGGASVLKHDLESDAACLLYSTTGEDGGGAVSIDGPFLVAGRLYEDRVCGLCPEQVEKYRRLFLLPHVSVSQPK